MNSEHSDELFFENQRLVKEAIDLRAKLAGENDRVDAAQLSFEMAARDRDNAVRDGDALAVQVVVLRKALEGPCMESAKWAFSNSLGSQGIMFELAQKAIAAINAALTATTASASAELRITSSPTDGFWLHVKTPSGLQAGIALGDLKNSIALRALAEVASMRTRNDDNAPIMKRASDVRASIDAARKATP